MKSLIILAVCNVIVFGISSYFAVTVYGNNFSDVETSPEIIGDTVDFDDVLSTMHAGQWFGWIDSGNKVYENLVVLDKRYSKPSKSELLAAISTLELARETAAISRNYLLENREAIQSRIANGSYTIEDLANYLRILGGF